MAHGAGLRTKNLKIAKEANENECQYGRDPDKESGVQSGESGEVKTHRIALVFDLAGIWLNLGVESGHELIQVLVDVDGRDGESHASGLVGANGSAISKRTDDETIAKQ